MKIHLTPSSVGEKLIVSVAGDAININGSVFDFSLLPEGGELPFGAIDSKWIVGSVSREDGEISLMLILPHGPNAPHETRFPAALHTPIIVTEGTVPLPLYDIEPDAEPVVTPMEGQGVML